MKKYIKIANAQGFWGDSLDAPLNMINYGDINYLTLDYLKKILTLDGKDLNTLMIIILDFLTMEFQK